MSGQTTHVLRAIRQRPYPDILSEWCMTEETDMSAIEAAMKARGYIRADFGRLLGLDSAQTTRTFNGKRKLQLHEYQTVATWLGLEGQIKKPGASVHPMPGSVPLFGWAAAADEDRFAMAEPNMLGTVPMHPHQINLRNAFAVRVHGDSMAPRYEQGEIVYVSPNQWPARDQDCVIETIDSHGYLKRFRGRKDEKLIVAQFNPAKEIEFLLKNIRAVHAVIGRG
jgi:SOS-response transcriptional repressor LexA